MEIKKTVTVSLKEDELKEIIANYVGQKLNKPIDPAKVVFQIDHKCEDYDDRFAIEYVKGCTISYLDN